MTDVSVQSILVFVTVALASLYLLRKLIGPAKSRKRRGGAPDVPVGALVRRKHGRNVEPRGATTPGGCDH